MMRCLSASLAALAALATTACSGVPVGDEGFRVTTGAGSFALNVAPTSLVEKRFTSVVRQQYDFSCGSAALATLLTYHYATPRDEQAVFQKMWETGDQDAIQRLGFSLLDMKSLLADLNISANGYRVSLDDVRKANLPGIALIAPGGYRHFVVVKGVEDDFVLVGDPSLGLRRMERSEFEESWNGVYFVITEGAEPTSTFNSDAQWGQVAYFGAEDSTLRPLSQQALSLTAPFYGEF